MKRVTVLVLGLSAAIFLTTTVIQFNRLASLQEKLDFYEEFLTAITPCWVAGGAVVAVKDGFACVTPSGGRRARLIP